MRASESRIGSAFVLKIHDARLEARTSNEIVDAIASVVARGGERILLELSAVRHIDNAFVSALTTSALGFEGKVELSITGAPALTGLDRTVRIHPTLSGALDALMGKG